MLTTTHLQQPQPTPRAPAAPLGNQRPNPRTPPFPFTGRGRQGNLFQTPSYRGATPGNLGISRGRDISQRQAHQPLRNHPLSEHHTDLMEFALQHHPDTDEGRAAHCAQCTKWHLDNPTSKPNERHQYLLTPGTATVGSFEFWGCSQQGHRSGAGQGTCAGDVLPQPEHNWHRIATFIKHEYNKERHSMTPTDINLISHPNLTYLEYHHTLFSASKYPGEVDDIPGNRQGSSS